MDRRDLRKLPPDLMSMGWQWISTESAEMRRWDPPRYKVVYARPFEGGIDDERLAVHRNGDVWIRVSVESASWDGAHHDAIGLMRNADDRRKPN